MYLEDVPLLDPGESVFRDSPKSRAFAKSRWFTRGWTLQELLAADDPIFFNHNWEMLTTKSRSCAFISNISGIGVRYLQNAKAIPLLA